MALQVGQHVQESHACDWTTTLEDIERGASVEYYVTVTDTSTAASGTNTNTTSTNTFEVGDPNKVFVVEWHDMGYSGTTNLCTYQALFYDVTNEIEFQYDTGCKASYDYATVGYQDQTRTKGATVRGTCKDISMVLTLIQATTESEPTAVVTPTRHSI